METGLKIPSLQCLASLCVIFSAHDRSLDAFLPHGLKRQKTRRINFFVNCPKKEKNRRFIVSSEHQVLYDCQFRIGQHIPRYLVIGFITFQTVFSCFLITQRIIIFFTNRCKSLSLAFITWLLFMKFHNGGLIYT